MREMKLIDLWVANGGCGGSGRVFIGNMDIYLHGCHHIGTHVYRGFGNVFLESGVAVKGVKGGQNVIAKGANTVVEFTD